MKKKYSGTEIDRENKMIIGNKPSKSLKLLYFKTFVF